MWSWGYNKFGQIGDGTTINRAIPVQAKKGMRFTRISAGDSYSSAIDSEGNLWSWGYNCYGQIGDGTTINRTTPVQVKTGTKVKQISAGNKYSLVIDSEGKVYGTGNAYYLGNPNLLMLTPNKLN